MLRSLVGSEMCIRDRLIVVCAVAPVLNLWVPAGSMFHLSDYAVALLGKIMCYAICALAMDLIWGYTGILSLGHGLFFALGGYGMGMYLMRQIGLAGNYKSELPDFMVFLNWKELPWHWTLSDSFVAQMLLVVAVPGLLAFVFGFFAFRSRIKGVYFSIITQALTFAAMLLFFRNETGFGGNNGFTDFKRILSNPGDRPQPPARLFGVENQNTWCYYYQKAELARQNQDWTKLKQIALAASNAGMEPQEPSEYMVFIEGFAMSGDWDQAQTLTDLVYQRHPKLQPSLCAAWTRFTKQNGTEPAAVARIDDVKTGLQCLP